MSHTKLHIDGQSIDTKERMTVINPLTRQEAGTCEAATEHDCIAAVEAAARAFPAWETTPLSKKREILLRTADLIECEFKQRLFEAQSRQTGGSDMWVNIGIAGAATYFRTAASMANELQGQCFDSDKPGGKVLQSRRAAGVVLSIIPWNSPIVLAARGLAVPLFCGNTIVLKASEYTPESTWLVHEALEAAGLPKGVVNFVTHTRKDAPQLTEAMIAHPAVKRINFTGSDVVGKLIAGMAAKHLKQCVFELGGKAATVVLEDADLDSAARAIVFASQMHGGQVCMSTERVIVRESVHDKLASLLQQHVSRLRAGEGGQISALFTESAAENVISQLNEAKKDAGVKVLVGDVKREGSIVQPHLLTGVKSGMTIWHEESFGPVTMLTVAHSDEEAIQLANDSEYTLMGALWTRDLQKAMEYGPRIRCGTLVVNGPTIHLESLSGNRGLGGRSGYGAFAVDAFTDLRKIVILPPNGGNYPLSQPLTNGSA